MTLSTILLSMDGLAAYYLDLPYLQLPNLRSLIAVGTYARRTTITFPTSTWISHTSMITGCHPAKHGVLGNWTINRGTRTVVEHFADQTDKETTVQVPTLYDAAKQAGLTTASVMWGVTRGARNLDYCIPEFYYQPMFETHVDPDLWQALRNAKLPVDRYAEWSVNHGLTGAQDWLTLRIGEYFLQHYNPDLLMIHFLLSDSLQHDYGVHSPEAYYAIEHCDLLLGHLLRTLDMLGMRPRTNLIVCSDHGHAANQYEVRPNYLFQQRGWQKTGEDMNKLPDGKPLLLSDETKAAVVTNGGSGYLYIFAEGEERAALVPEVLAALEETGTFEAILGPEHFAELGLALDHPETPDFVLLAKPSYYVSHLAVGGGAGAPFSKAVAAESSAVAPSKFKSMHGYHPSMPEMDGFAVFNGPSYPANLTLDRIHITDIAPTIARTMGIELPQADGQAIEVVV